MTSFHKPTPPGQENQEVTPSNRQEQIRRYMTPVDEKARPEAGTQGTTMSSGPGGVESPRPTELDYLPTGRMPTNSVDEQPGKNRQQASLFGSGLRPINQFSPATPTSEPEGASRAHSPQPNPPGNGPGLPIKPASGAPKAANPPGNGSGLLARAATTSQSSSNPPTNGPGSYMPQTQVAQQSFNQSSRGYGLAGQVAPPPPRSPQEDETPQYRPEVVNGNVILHRSEHFYLRTAYRPGQRKNPIRKPSGNTQMIPRVMPNQDNRIASSETRIMPSVSPINPLKKERFPIPAWFEAIVVVIMLAASFIAHAVNMFNFPRYELDEGTYMSSAWAILNGQITPYAYGYGHPPLAWMQIAAWIKLTGGFFTFGNAINSGRVFMIFIATGCGLLVYMIVRRLDGNRAAGLLALMIFSFSPLGITYQRQVLLDNVAIFWLLFSLYLLVVGNSRLVYIVSSALCFGLAILSKEVLLLFIPGMLYAVWLHTTNFQRKFALVAFTYTVIALVSGFVLLAILKGELFPYDWHLPWDTHKHLSMIDTYLYQGGRGQKEGSLLGSWDNWVNGDTLFMLGGVAAVAFNLLVGWWRRRQLLLALLAISFWLLMVRGGVVLSFYLIPLIPLTAMNTAMAINMIFGSLSKLVRLDLIRVALILGVIAALIPYDLKASNLIYTQHPTSVQNDAMVWVRDHIPRNDFIIINSYLYTDLRVPGGQGVGDGATYPYAHVYVNVATDPELYDKILQNNWDRIDYIVADSEVLSYIKGISATSTEPGHILRQALDHSILRTQFTTADHDQQFAIQVYEVQHKLAPSMVAVPSSDTSTGTIAIGTSPIHRRLFIG